MNALFSKIGEGRASIYENLLKYEFSKLQLLYFAKRPSSSSLFETTYTLWSDTRTVLPKRYLKVAGHVLQRKATAAAQLLMQRHIL